MNPYIDKIYSLGTVENSAGGQISCFPTSISYKKGIFLHDFLRVQKPSKTIEIGMAYGLSTLFICQALKDNNFGMHTVIDPFETQEWDSVGLSNLENAGLKEQLRFFEKSSEIVLPELYTANEKFDFAFLDGNHQFDSTFIEFYYLDKMLNINGYLAFDDIWLPAVRKVIAFILCYKGYEFMTINSKIPPKILTFFFKTMAGIHHLQFSKKLFKILSNNHICILKKVKDTTLDWRFFKDF